MPASNDTIREIAKAFGVTLIGDAGEDRQKLLDVPGNKSFRDAIEALARELMQR